MAGLSSQDPKVAKIIAAEERRQVEDIELIPSENYASAAVLEALGSVFNNKYSEGKPRRRYYGGNQYVDEIEELAIERAKKLFATRYHVNVQPYSGSPANFAVYAALMKPGEKAMGMKLAEGGHLTHGHSVSLTGQFWEFHQYGVDPRTERLDYEAIEKLAKKVKPKVIVTGYTAYPRVINFRKFSQIAKKVGAYLVADIAHIAGLVAAKVHPSPFPWADVVTTTTHKTLRGPRGAIIFCKPGLAQQIDRAVFPGLQGGPHDHVTAAMAVCFAEAAKAAFKTYARQIVKNAKTLAATLQNHGLRLVSGGTDNHLMLVDVTVLGLTGKLAQEALELVGIIVNKNTIPGETLSPFVGSGIRLGTPAVTSRGMEEKEMVKIADWIYEVLKATGESGLDPKVAGKISRQVRAFAQRFRVPSLSK